MDFQSFSQTYWYVWFIVALLIVVICLLNVVGVCLYDKKRRKFLHQEEKEEIPMTDSSSSSSTTTTPTMKYRQMSTPSARSEVFSTATFLVQPSIQQSNPSIQAKSSKSLFSLNTILEKSEMDLELEEFQRQALAEHNTMRKMYRKPPVKLCEALNLYAQHWAEHCARTNVVVPSRPEWRLNCKNDHIGENLLTMSSKIELDGHHFTALLMAKGNRSFEVDCVLNELTSEVGFGRAQIKTTNSSNEQKWVVVGHYYPYRPLPNVES